MIHIIHKIKKEYTNGDTEASFHVSHDIYYTYFLTRDAAQAKIDELNEFVGDNSIEKNGRQYEYYIGTLYSSSNAPVIVVKDKE